MDEQIFAASAKDLVIGDIVDDLSSELECNRSGHYLNNELILERVKVYVVWMVKVLEHNKCLIGTDVVEGYYWEVTYNGLKDEFYVARYRKESKRAVKR